MPAPPKTASSQQGDTGPKEPPSNQQDASRAGGQAASSSSSIPPNALAISFRVLGVKNLKGSKGERPSTLVRLQFADFDVHDSEMILENSNPEYNLTFHEILPNDESAVDLVANRSLRITLLESLPKEKTAPLGSAELPLFPHLLQPYLKDPLSDAPGREPATSFRHTLPLSYANPKLLTTDGPPELTVEVTLSKPLLTAEQLEKGAFGRFHFSALLPVPEEWTLKEGTEKDPNSNLYTYAIHFQLPTEQEQARSVVVPKGALTGVDAAGYYMDPASFTLTPTQVMRPGSARPISTPPTTIPGGGNQGEQAQGATHHAGHTFPPEARQVTWDAATCPQFWLSEGALAKYRRGIQDKVPLAFSLVREVQPKFAAYTMSGTDAQAARANATIHVDASLLLLSRVIGLQGRVPVDEGERLETSKLPSMYRELGSSIAVDIHFNRPIADKKRIPPMTKAVRDFIPARHIHPDDAYRENSAQANADYQAEVRVIVQRLMTEYAHLFQGALAEADRGASSAAEMQPDFRRKRFLHHLNVSGVYFEFKERLKTSVVGIVRERFKQRSPFAKDVELQVFLSDVYVYLVEQMHVAINRMFLEKQISNAFVDPDSQQTATMAQMKSFADLAEGDGALAMATMHHQDRILQLPQSLVPWFDYGAFCMRIGRPDKGEECFKEILARDAEHVPALLAYGSICASNYRLPEARVCLEAAVKRDPSSPLARAMLGYYFEINGDEAEAERVLATATALYRPSASGTASSSVHLHVARFLVEVHAVQMAERALAQETVQSGHQVESLMLLHQLEVQRGNLVAAREHLGKALHVAPANPAVLAALGHLAYRAGQAPEVALSFYEQVTNLRTPLDPVLLGLVFQRMGELYMRSAQAHPALLDKDLAEQSKRMFVQSCQAHPTHTSWLWLGKACIELGEFQHAEDALSEANVLNNKDARIWAYLALVSLTLRREYEANQCLSFALRLGVKDAAILVRVGKAFMRAQAHVQATECFRMALELDPQHVRAKQLFLEALEKGRPAGPEDASKTGGEVVPAGGLIA